MDELFTPELISDELDETTIVELAVLLVGVPLLDRAFAELLALDWFWLIEELLASGLCEITILSIRTSPVMAGSLPLASNTIPQ